MRLVIAMALASEMALSLSGCYTEKTVLTNDQGQTQTCQNTGHIGIISPIRVYAQQKSCIDKAKAAGYKETPSAPAATPAGDAAQKSG
jgi:outer membrane lipoprotein SlyB